MELLYHRHTIQKRWSTDFAFLRVRGYRIVEVFAITGNCYGTHLPPIHKSMLAQAKLQQTVSTVIAAANHQMFCMPSGILSRPAVGNARLFSLTDCASCSFKQLGWHDSSSKHASTDLQQNILDIFLAKWRVCHVQLLSFDIRAWIVFAMFCLSTNLSLYFSFKTWINISLRSSLAVPNICQNHLFTKEILYSIYNKYLLFLQSVSEFKWKRNVVFLYQGC